MLASSAVAPGFTSRNVLTNVTKFIYAPTGARFSRQLRVKASFFNTFIPARRYW